MNSHQPFIDKTQSEVYRAFAKAAKASGDAAVAAGLERGLLELVNTRVSQLNGCPACLSVHAPKARHYGVPQLKLDTLNAWHGSADFSAEERAALGLAEALTVSQEPHHTLHGPALHRAQVEAAEHFSPEQIGALEWVIIAINAFNRISIASGHPTVAKNYGA